MIADVASPASTRSWVERTVDHEETRAEMCTLMARYPQPRIGAAPDVHLVQSAEGLASSRWH